MTPLFARFVPVLAVLLVAGGLGGRPGTGARGGSAGRPAAVIYDADMDVDDTAALAYLCEADRRGLIDLRAVTVDNDGFGTPGRALVHARSVLRQCGEPGVPVADGSDSVVHAAPADTVKTVETVLTGALGDGSVPSAPSPVTAAQLIGQAIASAPGKVTILTTGPLSNLAQALRLWRAAHPGKADWLAGRIGGLYTMGGAISVPGNLFGSALDGFDGSQEFNMWLDPASARDVFRAMRPGVTHLVPLDATNDVPITPQYVDTLGADQHAASARLVYKIMTQPAMTQGISQGIYYWWDDLAAVSALGDNGGTIASFRQLRIDVVLAGAQSGRTVVSPEGVPQQVALSASRAGFEQAFLNGLNGR